MAQVYRARWLIPAEGPILEDAALVAEGGHIVRLGPWSSLKAHVGPGDAVEHFPDAALLPGFVNAHTHLSLSDMRGKFRPTKHFASWLVKLAGRRVLRSEAQMREAIRHGDVWLRGGSPDPPRSIAAHACPELHVRGGSGDPPRKAARVRDYVVYSALILT